MSHIVSIETQVRDATALRAACGRLSLDGPEWQTAKLFTSEATGYCVCLPKWRFPVVCNTKTGEVHYDLPFACHCVCPRISRTPHSRRLIHASVQSLRKRPVDC